MKYLSFAMAPAVALSLFAVSAPAAQAADIEVREAWSRASAGPARMGAAFMQIVNTGPQDDRLVAASAPVAPTTELHTHIREGDIMRMRQVEAIDLPAGETVTLQPGGLHVMFLGLHDPLRQGTTFDLTLEFEQAGTLSVPVTVMGAGSMGGAMGPKHGH